jgi:DegV family protein with EDD domain
MTAEGSVGIVTDSTADIPRGMAEAEGVTIVRLVTTFPDGASFKDGDLSQAEFFERMGRTKALPTTSQPPVGDFIAAYERLLESCSHVVSIHISGKLSGTVEAARQAAQQFGDRVRVVDSRNLSFGLGWPVLVAARAAQMGAAVADVMSAAERARDRSRLVVGVDKLDNLARGGRIGAVSALVGGLLDLKVVFTVSPDGSFAPIARVRGKKAALRETLDFVKREMKGATSGMFCVAQALAPETARELRDALECTFEATEMLVVETGVVIATHTGTAWGIGFLPGEPI